MKGISSMVYSCMKDESVLVLLSTGASASSSPKLKFEREIWDRSDLETSDEPDPQGLTMFSPFQSEREGLVDDGEKLVR